jgi:hypothetical protein
VTSRKTVFPTFSQLQGFLDFDSAKELFAARNSSRVDKTLHPIADRTAQGGFRSTAGASGNRRAIQPGEIFERIKFRAHETFVPTHGGAEFEIQDDWWRCADMKEFVRGDGTHYPFSDAEKL